MLIITLCLFIKLNSKNRTSEKLLVIVDYQKDFVDGALGFSGAEKLDSKIEIKIKKYLEENQDIIYTLDTHHEDYLETREGKFLPINHCIKDTQGHEVFGETAKYLDQAKRVFEKDTFGSNELAKFIAKSDYKEIEFVGLVSNICVLSNIILVQNSNKNVEISVDLSATLSNDDVVNNSLKNYLVALGVKVIA